MKNDEKAIIAGAGVILAYFLLQEKKEKIDVVNEIGKENPQLRADLFKNVFSSGNNIISNILPYLVALLIIYYLLKK